MKKMDFHNPQKGKTTMGAPRVKTELQNLPLRQHTTPSRMSDLSDKLSTQFLTATRQLSQLLERKQFEVVVDRHDWPRQALLSEQLIAQYIYESLRGDSGQNYNTPRILTLVKEYEVVRLRRGGRITVSLAQVLDLLQDNFPTSSLYSLLSFLVDGNETVDTKVIIME